MIVSRRRRTQSVVNVLVLVASTAALQLVAPVPTAVAQGCQVDSVSYKILGGGHRVWIGTNVYSYWTAGPATIRRTVQRAASAGSSHSSSDTVEGGVNYGIVSAKYNHTWERGTSTSATRTTSWGYDITIPRGMTARARVFHDGWNFPARKTVVYR